MGAGTIVIAGGGTKKAVDDLLALNTLTIAQSNNAVAMLQAMTTQIREFIAAPTPP